MMRRLAGTMMATALVAATPASADLLTNGGFETPTGYFTTYSGTQIPGWTVTTNNVDIASNAIYGASSAYAFEGTQWLDLVGTGRSGAIAQSFATTAGAIYQLSFAYANNPDYTPASANVSVVGLTTLLATAVTHANSTRTAAGWIVYTGSFTADSANATLSFTDTSHNLNAGVYLDAVSVQAIAPGVPEAATWSMMVAGVGAVGFALRRRRRETIAVRSA